MCRRSESNNATWFVQLPKRFPVVSDEFSARFSASSRRYRYFFPLREPCTSAIRLDIDAMKRAAKKFVGRHDFRNLCKMDVLNVSNYERVIYDADVYIFLQDETESAVFEVVGQAFLWHMVRCMMAILLEIGAGREKEETIEELLNIEKNPGKPQYDMAPELPLVLHECHFKGVQFTYHPCVLQLATSTLLEQYYSLSTSLTLIRNELAMVFDRRCSRETIREFLAIYKFTKDEVMDAWSNDGEDVKWIDVYRLCESYKKQSKDTKYVPWMERTRNKSYEDRLVELGPKKRERYDRQMELKNESQDGDFYKRKRELG